MVVSAGIKLRLSRCPRFVIFTFTHIISTIDEIYAPHLPYGSGYKMPKRMSTKDCVVDFLRNNFQSGLHYLDQLRYKARRPWTVAGQE